MNILNTIFSADFLFTSLRVMTPILYAALACMVFTKGGIDAIGTEGIMLACSLAGPVFGFFSHNAFVGVVCAMIVGVLMAYLFGYFTIVLHTNSVLAGIALNTLSGGLTVFATFFLTGNKGSTQSLNSPVIPNMRVPFLSQIPFLVEVFSGHNLITYLGWCFTIFLALFFWKMPAGIRVRAVGESEAAAKSVGLPIAKYKIMALTMAGALAGIGGAYMSMGYVSFFSRDMVAGRGWIGMAAEAMGKGLPGPIMLAVLIFGMADCLAIRLQILNLPSQLIQCIPYMVTIIAISVYSYMARQKKKSTKKKRISALITETKVEGD